MMDGNARTAAPAIALLLSSVCAAAAMLACVCVHVRFLSHSRTQ